MRCLCKIGVCAGDATRRNLSSLARDALRLYTGWLVQCWKDIAQNEVVWLPDPGSMIVCSTYPPL